ncbi:MAG: amidophosphoribosyltransferase [Mycobacterium sp.]|nr:amidophosphoribosyltransferase [Mycobacterium sp.]
MDLASDGQATGAGGRDDDGDRPREACGVIAVHAPGQPVVGTISDGLHALQHRGQESAGLAISQGTTITVVKNTGLVTDVLNRRTVGFLEGHLGIGHTRYSTTGASTWENSQPSFRSTRSTDFALAHNGNLTNTVAIAQRVGVSPVGASNDTDRIAELLAEELDTDHGWTFEQAVARVVPQLEGAFSLVLMNRHCIIGVRDPNGFRPLCLGKFGDGGWVLASETAALDTIGAQFVREVLPGEMVVIDQPDTPNSVTAPCSVYPFAPERIDPKLCLFEFVYLARPDSYLCGAEVHAARMRMGAMLARKAPVDADMVMGVPESGIPASEGYAQESGLPWGTGLVKNRYIGRSFINPTQGDRERNVRRKLNVLKERVRGKRLIVVEDSIVRGTVTRYLAKMLRDAGATEVHLRITLPPVKWPCYYGIDIGSREELLAANHTLEDIRQLLGVESLAYLGVADLRAAIGLRDPGLCDACMTNNYPTSIPLNNTRALERTADPVG